MDRYIINFRQLEKIKKLRYTTKGTRRIRALKGLNHSMRERVLRKVSRSRPEVMDRLWQGKKCEKAKKQEPGITLKKLTDEDRQEFIMGLLSKTG